MKLFSTSKESIRLWSIEFAKYLTPTAAPSEKGRHRQYSDSDLEVFSLIARMKDEGHTEAEIHVALANGQRDNVPQRNLALIPPEAQLEIRRLRDELTRLQALSAEYETFKEAAAQNKLLKEQFAEAQAEIKRLTAEKAVLEYRLNQEKNNE